MSKEYDLYLDSHKCAVAQGFHWIVEHLPAVIERRNISLAELTSQICACHDASKYIPDEYFAYDAYFYGTSKSFEVKQDFNKAWLLHIHRNPHHWQYWVLANDDPGEGTICIDIPYNYIIEMICDWWSFSWRKGNLYEIFDWYESHKDHIQMTQNSRSEVELILTAMKNKLEGLENEK